MPDRTFENGITGENLKVHLLAWVDLRIEPGSAVTGVARSAVLRIHVGLRRLSDKSEGSEQRALLLSDSRD